MDYISISGFDFLVLYGLGLFSALLGTFFAKKFIDNSLSYGIKSVTNFEPVQVAYLRGGVKEVIKVGLIGLYNKKDIENAKITEIEAILQNRLHNKTRPNSKIYLDATVLYETNELCKIYEYELLREKLVFSEATQNVFKTLKYLYYAVFLGLGTFRVITGLINDKPVLYLVGLMFMAIVLIAPVTRLPRLTRRGTRYLEDLSLTYKQKLQDFSKKEKDKKNNTSEPDSADSTYASSNPTQPHNDYVGYQDDTVFLAGLFGASALADSNPDYGFLEDEPKRNYDSTSNSPSDSGSTWNSSDSSDSGSSSSDSGGSSDGGGSGCGGCGGGCGGGGGD